MSSTDSTSRRKSQSILKGLVTNQPNYRAESVPVNQRPSKRPESINHVKENREDRKTHERKYSRCKSSCGTSLNQIGLPEDTFDGTIIMSSKKDFHKSVEDLKKQMAFVQNSDSDLKSVKKEMLRDLKVLERSHYYPTNSRNDITDRSSIHESKRNEKIPQNYRQQNVTYFDNDQDSNIEDSEVCELNAASISDMYDKDIETSRSNSALSSRIPMPIKPVLNQRCKSKLELRIQRRLSVQPPNSKPTESTPHQPRRKASYQGAADFTECF